jgi:CDGSH-type Zn-finger protein
MNEPVVAGKAPIECELEAGEFWWCACGRSQNQPWCDGSHKGTGFSPVALTIAVKSRVTLCACKHTANPPYCDGAHELLD